MKGSSKKKIYGYITGMLVLGVIGGGIASYNNYSKASEIKKQEVVENNDLHNEKIKSVVRKFIDDFYDKDYESVLVAFGKYANVGPDKFTVEKLSETGKKYFYKDRFEEIQNINIYKSSDEISTVYFTIKEKHRTLSNYMTIDKEYSVVGYKIYNTSPLPEKSEDYKEEKIQVGSLDNYKLDGILTLPTNKTKPPVVILVHGSGFNDSDESIGPNRPFADIAHELAKKGIATVRYNERFYQYGNLITLNNDKDKDGIPDMKYTLYTEAIDDACSIVDQISKDCRIDSNNIYIGGHSLGGMVAPKIAELNSKVKGIISLAGTPRTIVDVTLDQNLLSIDELNNITDKEKEEMKEQQIASYAKLYEEIGNGGHEYIGIFTKDFLLSDYTLNTKQTLSQIDIPMLIMQGEDDLQIYADKDFVEWQHILDGRKNCHFKLYKGLNHMFMKSKGYGITNIIEEYYIKGNVEEQVINDMAEFINKYSAE